MTDAKTDEKKPVIVMNAKDAAAAIKDVVTF